MHHCSNIFLCSDALTQTHKNGSIIQSAQIVIPRHNFIQRVFFNSGLNHEVNREEHVFTTLTDILFLCENSVFFRDRSSVQAHQATNIIYAAGQTSKTSNRTYDNKSQKGAYAIIFPRSTSWQ